jgi:MFS transporter, MFS domain-containing protein family, molybdate-anion transporter
MSSDPLPYTGVFWAVVLTTLAAHFAAVWSPMPPPSSTSSDSQLDKSLPSSHVVTAAPASLRSKSFSAFQANYLSVYLLAVAADWLQGPYVYALYTHYGYSKADVGQLYIAGFASSAVFGTLVASVADKYGRKSNALLYCAVYMASCATKHSSAFPVLFLGRLLGGVAYSILFSAFESWMVYEHSARGYSASLLASTFARAQLCNGVVAIASGKVAGWFATRYGKVAPFDVAVVLLALLAVLVAFTWTENYGNKTQSVGGGFVAAWRALVADPKILLLGIIQASFEGAMYTFTFVWTPALQAPHDAANLSTGLSASDIPHGTIFSTFMAATMIGSSLFAMLSRTIRVEVVMRGLFVLGTALFAAPVVSGRVEVVYASFVAFEVLCGVYFPAMGTMRAPYIPEENRSALLTFFRVPLNVIVVVTLYEDLSLRRVLVLCAGLMAIAAVCQQRLLMLSRRTMPTSQIPYARSILTKAKGSTVGLMSSDDRRIDEDRVLLQSVSTATSGTASRTSA